VHPQMLVTACLCISARTCILHAFRCQKQVKYGASKGLACALVLACSQLNQLQVKCAPDILQTAASNAFLRPLPITTYSHAGDRTRSSVASKALASALVPATQPADDILSPKRPQLESAPNSPHMLLQTYHYVSYSISLIYCRGGDKVETGASKALASTSTPLCSRLILADCRLLWLHNGCLC